MTLDSLWASSTAGLEGTPVAPSLSGGRTSFPGCWLVGWLAGSSFPPACLLPARPPTAYLYSCACRWVSQDLRVCHQPDKWSSYYQLPLSESDRAAHLVRLGKSMWAFVQQQRMNSRGTRLTE